MTKLEKLSEDILLWSFDSFPPVYPLQRRGELTRYQNRMLDVIRPFVLFNDIRTIDNVHQFYKDIAEEPVDFVMKVLRMAYDINRYIKQYTVPAIRNEFYTIKKLLMYAVMTDERFRQYIKVIEIDGSKNSGKMYAMKVNYVNDEYILVCPCKNIPIRKSKINFSEPFDIIENDEIVPVPDDFDVYMNTFVMCSFRIFHNSDVLPDIAGHIAIFE